MNGVEAGKRGGIAGKGKAVVKRDDTRVEGEAVCKRTRAK